MSAAIAPRPQGPVLASHVGGRAAPGLIVRHTDITTPGTTTPQDGEPVRISDFTLPDTQADAAGDGDHAAAG